MLWLEPYAQLYCSDLCHAKQCYQRSIVALVETQRHCDKVPPCGLWVGLRAGRSLWLSMFAGRCEEESIRMEADMMTMGRDGHRGTCETAGERRSLSATAQHSAAVRGHTIVRYCCMVPDPSQWLPWNEVAYHQGKEGGA